jgi:sterol 14-demethylase
MSNASLPFPDVWSTYLSDAQAYFPTRIPFLLLVNIPLIAIILNVLWQLVRS